MSIVIATFICSTQIGIRTGGLGFDVLGPEFLEWWTVPSMVRKVQLIGANRVL